MEVRALPRRILATWEPKLSIQRAEELVRRLPDVSGCRIHTDPSGRPTTVHVTALAGSAPERVARDVVTVLAAEAGIDVDAAAVHVVELPEEAPPIDLEPLEVEGRVRLVALGSSVSDERSIAEVELALGDRTALGRAEARGAGLAPELMAEASLDALEKLCASRVTLRLLGLRRAQVDDTEVVIVAVQECAGRDERRLVGAARFQGDFGRAAAYAALDALNRRLGRILVGPVRQFDIS